MSTASALEYFHLGSFTVPRLWVGLWQLSSTAWGSAPAPKIRGAMKHHIDHGFTAFADHYGSSEILFGQVRESLPAQPPIVGATKWCVFKDVDPTRAVVEAAVRERVVRMRTTSVDLLQFHWHNYANKGYLTALQHLVDLRSTGIVRNIGLVNFDAIRTDEICTQLGPGAISTHQVQFSLIDTRPLHGMADVCEKHGLKLLTYGTLCGGFLADAWLGQPEPDPYMGKLTPSQRKYLEAIKVWGGWVLFQELLAVLQSIGARHGGASITNIAMRWVLDHPFVGAILVGTRLGVTDHIDDNLRVFALRLTDGDRAEIEVVLARSAGRRMITLIGDCGAEYR
ncbi:Aldo/keto reductase [Vararia minispora EC-137]|uniref:Aldo/keto reductase n=1 Tax=Vararia minispora EC-137 TaxID=1314806 RepID=A0ACB8QJK7_9AGAM|nr:Aldo/keto reductase [Vararia minispora EC-137]